jgi:hypothetical protein
MHVVFTIFRYWPILALPLIFAFFQIGVHFLRKGNNGRYWCWGGMSVLALSIFIWLIFRGDLNSDEWARMFLGLN